MFWHVALNSQIRRDYYRGSQDCLAETRRTSTSSLYSGMLNVLETISGFDYITPIRIFATFIYCLDVNDEGKLNTPRNLDRHGSYKNSRG